MRLLSATAILALAFSTGPLLAQAADPHAGPHPEAEAPTPAPDTQAPATSDKACPMMDQMKGGMAGSRGQGNMSGKSAQDMKAMHDAMMKKCMDAAGKEGDGTDQHQH